MPTAIEQDVLRQEQRLIEASRALDLETLDSIYADDLLLSGVMGEPTCGKAAVLDEVRRGIVEREQAHASQAQVSVSAENEDMQVGAHGDTVITNYRFVVTITGPNMEVRRRYRKTNVWMKRNARWQIVAGHMAFVLDPKQAALLSGEAH